MLENSYLKSKEVSESLEKIPNAIVVQIDKNKFQKENCASEDGRNTIFQSHNNWWNCDESITLLDGKYYPLFVYEMSTPRYDSKKKRLYEWVFISFDSGKNNPGGKSEIKISRWNDNYELTDEKIAKAGEYHVAGKGLPILMNKFRYLEDYGAGYFVINKPVFNHSNHSIFSRLEIGEKDQRGYCKIIKLL